MVGSTAARNLAITNHCGGDVDLAIGDVQGPDFLLFSVSPAAGTTIAMKDGETRSLALKYQPIRPSPTQYQAYFALSVCSSGPDCSAQVVLQGIGVATGVGTAPDVLSFSFVPLNQPVTKPFTVTNVANTTIHLVPSVLNASDGGTVLTGPFQPGPAFPAAGTDLLPGQSLPIPITFTPTSAAFFEGRLDLATDDTGSSLLTLPMNGYGGGPSVSCAPNSLDFGLNYVGLGWTLSVICTNVGVDVPGHPEANLIFPDPSAVPPGTPFQHQSQNFGVSFDANAPPTALGLAVGQSAMINVRYYPSAASTDNDTLLVASNDAANPLTSIALTGTGIELPACDYQINPSSGLAFGHVASGTVAVLPFEIVNQGSADCLVKGLVTDTRNGSAFSVVDVPTGTSGDYLIPAGGSLTINVQFAPPVAAAQFSDNLVLYISYPQRPWVFVPLLGSSLAGCLVIEPLEVDFGVAGYDPAKGSYCAPNSRTLTIVNVCDVQQVVVSSVRVLDSAGSNQFLLTADPSPIILLPFCYQPPCPVSPPVTFQVSFPPEHSGPDLGGIAISADLAEPYLVPLKGVATQSADQTDSFTARAAELDLLWVLDTGDPGDVSAQQSIISDLSSFLAFPQQNGIDLHMATTSTDVYANAGSEDGRMEPCPGCKVDGAAMQLVTLAGGLQSAATSLGTLMGLGAGVSCTGASCNGFASYNEDFEAASEALSPAALNGYNQAFYRDEAALAVIVVVGDAEDDQDDLHGARFFYDAFISLKGIQRADQFSLSRVSLNGGIGSYQRLSQMARTTGGVEVDLADTGTPNWTDELNGLWPKLAPQLLNYTLSGTPVPSSLSVTDNGTLVPVSNWTYDATANAIRFAPSAFPPAGDTLQVSYTLACGN